MYQTFMAYPLDMPSKSKVYPFYLYNFFLQVQINTNKQTKTKSFHHIICLTLRVKIDTDKNAKLYVVAYGLASTPCKIGQMPGPTGRKLMEIWVNMLYACEVEGGIETTREPTMSFWPKGPHMPAAWPGSHDYWSPLSAMPLGLNTGYNGSQNPRIQSWDLPSQLLFYSIQSI